MDGAENPKKTEGNPENLTEAKKRFREKYGSGICRKLYEAGVVTDPELCAKETEAKVATIADRWEKGWTEGIKRFLGLK